MAVDSRRKARLKREKEVIWKQLCDFMESEEYQNDLIWNRVYELTEGKHGRLKEAMKIACKEFGIE